MVRIGDLVRAMLELGYARARLGAMPDGSAIALDELSPEEECLIKRVAHVIPRVAARLPWRADCLVQATAAKRWLSASGIASTIHFGVLREKQPAFEAHAWLTVGTRIVTGGDISGYVPLEN